MITELINDDVIEGQLYSQRNSDIILGFKYQVKEWMNERMRMRKPLTCSGGKLCSNWRMLLLYWHCQWLRAQATQSSQPRGHSVTRLLYTASRTSTGWAPGSFNVRSINFGSLRVGQLIKRNQLVILVVFAELILKLLHRGQLKPQHQWKITVFPHQ